MPAEWAAKLGQGAVEVMVGELKLMLDRPSFLMLLASSALTGSSQISSRGCVASARAIDTRWR
jgi:hypothetical protein